MDQNQLLQEANTLRITISELETLNKNANVYERPTNGTIFFRTRNKDSVLVARKKELAKIEKQLKK